MGTFLLKNHFQGNYTSVENIFIDRYMAKANGEYVKIYLFLLRHLQVQDTTLALSDIADYLENTERDVIRAIQYWEKCGLLSLEKNPDGSIASITIQSRIVAPAADHASLQEAPTPIEPFVSEQNDDPATVALQEDTLPSLSEDQPTSISSFRSRKELKQVLFVTEQYLGKTLTRSEMETITYFYETLHFSCDLIEYLIEYCVGKGKKSMHYINQVALNWAEKKISTVKDAKEESCSHNKDYYRILQAMGITGRAPATVEVEYMTRWSRTYGFSTDMILEACRRTISQTHQPSFEYADKILSNWYTQGVRSSSDVAAADEVFQRGKLQKAQTTQRSSAKRTVSKVTGTFPQKRAYDYDALEEQLLKSN
jgi:DnaD/phage-associated family protein